MLRYVALCRLDHSGFCRYAGQAAAIVVPGKRKYEISSHCHDNFGAAGRGGGIWLWAPDLKAQPLKIAYLRSTADLVEVDGVRLHLRDDGPNTAPAIIMLHVLGASLHTWEPWAQSLAPQFRVIRLDLPGSGLGPPDPTHDYTDARSLHLLLALMDQLDLRRATLVGNSMGG